MKKSIRQIFLDNLSFIAASLAYIIAHALDYLFTVQGIKKTGCSEGNPIIQGYIDQFGVETGILSFKLVFCISLLIGLKAVDMAHKKRQRRIKAEHILYGGAILTALGGVLWILPL